MAKTSAPEWENGGQRGRKKYGALFGGNQGDVAVASQRSTCRAEGRTLCTNWAGQTIPGKEFFICGSLPGSSCEKKKKRNGKTKDREEKKREIKKRRNEKER